MPATDSDLREQMMEWGAQRDEARHELAETTRRLERALVENERLRAAVAGIRDRASRALDNAE